MKLMGNSFRVVENNNTANWKDQMNNFCTSKFVLKIVCTHTNTSITDNGQQTKEFITTEL